ncbi:MAG: VanZ family protein [Candidatus Omnitrophota bacterium]
MAKNFVRYWVPFYAYAALIFYLSSLSKVLPEIDIPSFDKFLHVIEYGVFGILAIRAFKNSKKAILKKHFGSIAILVSILYGISDEAHQAFVPGRYFSYLDMVFDTIGSIMGVLIYGRYYSF